MTKEELMNPDYDGASVVRTAEWNEAQRRLAAIVAESALTVVDAKAKLMTARGKLAASRLLVSTRKRKRDVGDVLKEEVSKREADLRAKRRAAREEELVKSSVHSTSPAFLTAPMGAHGAGGVNSATPPDMLHQYSLGLMKRAVKKTIALIKSAKQPATAPRTQRWPRRAQRLATLDMRLSRFNTRHNGKQVYPLRPTSH